MLQSSVLSVYVHGQVLRLRLYFVYPCSAKESKGVCPDGRVDESIHPVCSATSSTITITAEQHRRGQPCRYNPCQIQPQTMRRRSAGGASLRLVQLSRASDVRLQVTPQAGRATKSIGVHPAPSRVRLLPFLELYLTHRPPQIVLQVVCYIHYTLFEILGSTDRSSSERPLRTEASAQTARDSTSSNGYENDASERCAEDQRCRWQEVRRT